MAKEVRIAFIIGLTFHLLIAMSTLPAHSEPLESPDGQNSGRCASWDRWTPKTKVDPITRTVSKSVEVCAHADSNGRKGEFDVTATCDHDDLNLEVTYFSSSDKNARFKVGAPFGVDVLVFEVRARLDETVRTLLTSNSQYNNVAILSFNNGPNPLPDVPASMQRASRREFEGSKEVIMEFELLNGDKPILTLHPQDSAFHEFFSQKACVDTTPITKTETRGPQKNTADAHMRYAAVIIVGGPPAANVIAGRFWIIGDDIETAFLRDGMEIPEGRDAVEYIRRTCQSSPAECQKIMHPFYQGPSAPINASGKTSLERYAILAGTHHLIMIGTGTNNKTYVVDEVVDLKEGPNTIPFPQLH